MDALLESVQSPSKGRVFSGEKRLLEMIASGRPLRDILAAVCEFFEADGDESLCSVYPIDWDGPTFRGVVGPSLPGSFLVRLEGLAVRMTATPCAAAAQTRVQVIVKDIDTDPQWRESPAGAHLRAHGIRSACATPITSRDGRVLGAFCVYRRTPATPSPRQRERIAQATHIASIALDRERREAELKRSETFLTQAQRLTRTGSLWWKVSTGEVAWSEEMYRLMEYPVTVTPSVELALNRTHSDDVAFVREKLSTAVQNRATADFEHRLLMPDGRVKHVRVVFQSVYDAEMPEYVGAVTDITERRQVEETLGGLRAELAHVARVTALGTLTASIAHEVSQPLAGIVTNASACLRMLATESPNVDGARQTARRLIRDASRASDVITRLRALFSKKTSATDSIDMNEATREVVTLMRGELQRASIQLYLDFSEPLPSVVGDRVQLQQVLINLIRNAAEAMTRVDDRPRDLVISTVRDDEQCVRVSVRDSGAGFDHDGAAKLFDAFYTTKDDGMGIGLSVSRSIIENHRGRLWAVSNDGPGATFSFAIPCGP